MRRAKEPTMKIHHLPRSTSALALALTLAGVTGIALDRSTTAGPAPALDSARMLSQAFRDVARTLQPSVVGVLATREPQDAPAVWNGQGRGLRRLPQGHPQMPDFPFDLFGLPEGQLRIPSPGWRGQGTGVIVREDGLIATNNHVVDGATRVQVQLADGKRLPAEVVGTDPDTDLALLRVKETGLPAAQLGDDEHLEPGDWVVAIGNPFGLDHSVTVGVVSALGRSGVGVATYEGFIQTDAAINPGNSGGPLVDLDGRVIGINTAIRSSAGGSDGIGFAIPISTLETVMPHLEKDGLVRRGWLGVSIQDLSPELAHSFGLAGTAGALVSDIVEGTPAAEAGLAAGDLIQLLDGQSVENAAELSRAIAARAPGTEVELRVRRDGAEHTFTVELGRRPGRDEDGAARGERPEAPARWGLGLAPLQEGLARQLEVDEGVLVRNVQPGSPADDAGLRPGDVILTVGTADVSSLEECLAALRSDEAASGVRLRVRTEGGTHWVFLSPRATE
jgi:serine protease Do